MSKTLTAIVEDIHHSSIDDILREYDTCTKQLPCLTNIIRLVALTVCAEAAANARGALGNLLAIMGAKAAHLVLHAAVQAMPEQAKLARSMAETLNAGWALEVAKDNLRKGENKTPVLIDLIKL